MGVVSTYGNKLSWAFNQILLVSCLVKLPSKKMDIVQISEFQKYINNSSSCEAFYCMLDGRRSYRRWIISGVKSHYYFVV